MRSFRIKDSFKERSFGTKECLKGGGWISINALKGSKPDSRGSKSN